MPTSPLDGRGRAAALTAGRRDDADVHRAGVRRRGEALGLDRGDFDPATGVLTIREAKFHKPRQLPLHPFTAAALTAYAPRRDRLCPRPRTGALLVSTTGARLAATTVSQTVRTLLRETGRDTDRTAG